MVELSILIPSRNERWLEDTIKDLKQHKESSTEILWMEDEGFGQRMCTNFLVKESKAKYVMKVDAHCSFSQGFDRLMLEEMDDKTILAPLLMPLDPISWSVNGKKQMAQFVFDTNFVMQHAEGGVGDTMCLQGSAWMVSRENYWKWELGDETMPSWGGQGPELGIKASLNGGRCRTTNKAYYGHVFRLSDADFPYDRGKEPGKLATEELKRRYFNKSIVPLVEKFNYPANWTRETLERLL